jgi:hypothetical protein
MEVGVGDLVYIQRGNTSVIGFIDGVKFDNGELERISIQNMEFWFWMQKGWEFQVVDIEEETDGQI